MLAALLVSVLLLAEAQPPSPTPAQAVAAEAKPAPKKAKGDEITCRDEAVLGTRFPKRVCRSRLTTEDQRRQDRAVIEDMQRGFGTPPSN